MSMHMYTSLTWSVPISKVSILRPRTLERDANICPDRNGALDPRFCTRLLYGREHTTDPLQRFLDFFSIDVSLVFHTRDRETLEVLLQFFPLFEATL